MLGAATSALSMTNAGSAALADGARSPRTTRRHRLCRSERTIKGGGPRQPTVPTENSVRGPRRASERERDDHSGPPELARQDVSMRWIAHLLALINALAADRSRLALENIALRQQIAVLKRSVKRAKIHDSDRVFWILMRRLLKSWRDTLLIVQPETVIRWHRKGWKYYWHRKCQRGTPGTPQDRSRSHRTDPPHVEGQRHLGRTPNPLGAGPARP